jgi:hypothetical protein
MYLLALVILAKAVETMVMANPLAILVGFGKECLAPVAGTAVYGLGMALIPFSLGRGIAHGSHDMWLLLRVAASLAIVQSIPSRMNLNLIWAYTEGFSKVEAIMRLVKRGGPGPTVHPRRASPLREVGHLPVL